MTLRHRKRFSLACLSLAVTLGGCLAEGDVESPDNQSAGGQNGNAPPAISGSPKTSTKIGEPWSFTPTASDPDGDTLTFSVENSPRWATFDQSSGTLSGTPNMGDEGNYSSIRISVSDGSNTISMPSFAVTVSQTGSGAATLSWSAPMQNEDGTSLTDLAGYKIYYGVDEGSYPNQVVVDNPGITTYVVENLSPDTYYFVSTAFNNRGIESDYSNVVTKVIN